MVLVAHFVLPRSETPAGQDVLLLEVGQDLGQRAITLKAGSGITMVKATNISADNLILWLQQISIDQALDAVGQQSIMVNRLIRRFGNLEHDGPVRSGLRLRRGGLLTVGQLLGRQLDLVFGLVMKGVVGENGSPIERAVVFREVQLE